MANGEELAYRPFRKTAASPILYWRAYRWGKQGGYAGTAVVPTTLDVFTAPTEERLREMAQELGFDLRRATDSERPFDTEGGAGPGSPALGHP